MATAETAKLIALLELQDKFSGPASRIDRSVGGLERSVGRLDRIGGTASRGLSNLTGNVVRLGAVAGTVVVGGLTASVVAASNLNEEIDKARVVFGPASEELEKFAAGAASIGLSKAEALGAAGAFGNMFNTVGLAQDKSADMSETMVQLAADMASFNNEDPSEMLDKLRSGLSGEAEPLRRFGVLLSEASVKTFAYENGIADAGEALTEAQKVQARYGLILEQTTIQQGNFADTSESLANQQRQLRANLSNTGATLGQSLLPAVGKVAKAVNELFIDKQPQIAAFGTRIGEALEKIVTPENLDTAMAKVGEFIDKLASGDFSGVAGNIGTVASAVSGLPWQAIGDAATLLGTGSKALLDAFLGLPPWVQTAVLTGWGLNKLTGGALGSIVGELGKGIIKGVMNMNAGVVNLNAGRVVGGGGGGLPTGGGGRAPRGGVPTFGGGGALGGALKFLGPLGGVLAALQIAGFAGVGPMAPTEKTNRAGTGQKVQVEDSKTREGVLLANRTNEKVEASVRVLRGDQQSAAARQIAAIYGVGANVTNLTGSVNGVSGAVSGLGPRIDRVANTPHNVTVHNTVSPRVILSVHEIQRRQQSANRSYSDLSAGF